MHSWNHHVGFDLVPDYSRPPRDDELYVIKAFARHASHCTACARPYEVHRQGGTLCAKGHQRARDVAQYLYGSHSQAFSLFNREGDQRIHVEIPAGCEVVRDLLKAMERGLRLRRQAAHAQACSYDETYYVAPRRVQSANVEPQPSSRRTRTKPRLETAEPLAASTYSIISSDGGSGSGSSSSSRYSRRQPAEKKTSYIGRGSLFEEDMREREQGYRSAMLEQQRQQQPIYRKAASRNPRSVPYRETSWH